MIPVTKSFLPPIENYVKYLEEIYKNCQLTNRGNLVQELEGKIKKYLNVDNILLTNNGTFPIQIALKLLANEGEVITTPFSYIATTSSIIWENCEPVFVDIHPNYLTIDENKIEAAITNKTTCILATHVFGNACNTEVIESIAEKYKLNVIYDAAHCFGVTYNGKSLFEYGDISTCSFHATKLFHTGEGGGVFSKNELLRKQIFNLHNFGHNGPYDFVCAGVNGKLSELQAAMGLAVLPFVDEIINSRRNIVTQYNEKLSFKNFRTLTIRKGVDWNFSYYPIIFNSEEELLIVLERLNKKNIFPRRYFYPSLNTLSFVKYSLMTNSEKISKTILCLPLFNDLKTKELDLIVELINN